MTTTITRAQDYARLLDSLHSLDDAIAQARRDADHAWNTQTLTTQEEGYTQEQADVAIEQAKAAERHYQNLYNLREARYFALLTFENDSLRDAEPADFDPARDTDLYTL
jgi:hypothetical protein